MFEIGIPAVLGFLIGFSVSAVLYYRDNHKKHTVKYVKDVMDNSNNPMLFHHEQSDELIKSLKEEVDIPNDKQEVREMIIEILPLHLPKETIKELASTTKSIKETIDVATNYMINILELNKEDYDVSCCFELTDKELYDLIFREIEDYIKRENITATIAKSLSISDNHHKSEFETGLIEISNHTSERRRQGTISNEIFDQYYAE